MMQAYNPDAYAAAWARDIEYADRRTAGVGTLIGIPAIQQWLRSLLDDAEDVANRADDVLAASPDAILVRNTNIGTLRASRGAYERPFLLLMVFGSQGLVARMELFDHDREAEALARFDELAGSEALHPAEVFANAASRSEERIMERWAARDWEGVVALYSPACRFDDRRRLVHLEIDAEDFLAQYRMLFDQPRSRWHEPLLATRGERLSLHRVLFQADVAEGGGPLEFGEHLALIEVDPDGRQVGIVAFDLDDLDAAYAELDRRYVVGEAAPYPRAAELLQRLEGAAAARDWEQWTAGHAPDFVLEDHRRLGWGTLHSRDEYLRYVRALIDLAPDVTYRTEHVLALDDRGILIIRRTVGSHEGGPFEIPHAAVIALGPDGRIQRAHAYDLDQLAEARARYEEIVVGSRVVEASPPYQGGVRGGRSAPSGNQRPTTPDPLRIPPNAATRAGRRWLACIDKRDWEGMAALFKPTVVFEDRRRLFHTTGDRDMAIASTREIIVSLGARPFSTLLATVGDRLALYHILFSAGSEGSQFEVDTLHLAEVDAEGRFVAVIAFDPDDRRAAAAEMIERFTRSEAGRCIPPAAVEAAGAMNAHDLLRVRTALSDDFVVTDHRRAGLGRLGSPDEYVAAVAALFEQAPDIVFEPLYIVAAAAHGPLVVQRASGTLANGGGKFEQFYGLLSRHRGGRLIAVEFFEAEDLDRARARFEELRTSEGG